MYFSHLCYEHFLLEINIYLSIYLNLILKFHDYSSLFTAFDVANGMHVSVSEVLDLLRGQSNDKATGMDADGLSWIVW